MVTDMFGALLQELGSLLEATDLHPDRNNTCLIRLKSGLEIQLEIDRSGEFLILGADLGSVPPGKYRENLFRESLKANNLPYPLHGVLAYSRKSDHLVLFEKLYIKELNGEKIAAEITPFADKAMVWKNAVAQSDIPVINQAYTSTTRSAGMFGLRP
jgi:hypothetical protein